MFYQKLTIFKETYVSQQEQQPQKQTDEHEAHAAGYL
jgi:hypothetical protein